MIFHFSVIINAIKNQSRKAINEQHFEDLSSRKKQGTFIMKPYKLAWSVSLLVIAFITIFSVISSNNGLYLSDTLTRIFGVLDLCAVAVLIFTSVKIAIWKKKK